MEYPDTLARDKSAKPVLISDPGGDGYTLNADANGNAVASGGMNPGNPDCTVTATLTIGGETIPGTVSYPSGTTWSAVFDMSAITTDQTDGVLEVTNSCGGSATRTALAWNIPGEFGHRRPRLRITSPVGTPAHPHPRVGRVFHVRGTVSPRHGVRLSVDVQTAQEIPLFGIVVPPIDLSTGEWSATVSAFEHGDNYSARAHLTDAEGNVLVQTACGPFQIL